MQIPYQPILWQVVAIRNFLHFAMCIYAYGAATLYKPEPANDMSKTSGKLAPTNTDSGPIATASSV